MRLVGSIAPGEDTPLSDVDLLAHFEPDVVPTVFDDLEGELEQLLGVHVDVVSDRGLRRRHAQLVADAVAL